MRHATTLSGRNGSNEKATASCVGITEYKERACKIELERRMAAIPRIREKKGGGGIGGIGGVSW